MPPKGLYKVLGPREQELMEYFWEHGRSSSSEVSLHMKRPVTTVNTTLHRMAEKGLLIEEKSQRKYSDPTARKLSAARPAIERRQQNRAPDDDQYTD